MGSPNNSNRPPMRIKLADNESLRALVAAHKVKMILAKSRSGRRG